MTSSTNLQSLEQFEQKLYFIKIIKVEKLETSCSNHRKTANFNAL